MRADSSSHNSVAALANSGAPFRAGKSEKDNLPRAGDIGYLGSWSRVLNTAERTTLDNAGAFFDPIQNDGGFPRSNQIRSQRKNEVLSVCICVYQCTIMAFPN